MRANHTYIQQSPKSLADYLYGYGLMVRCKEVAVRVSPQTWEAIEGRMLLLPD